MYSIHAVGYESREKLKNLLRSDKMPLLDGGKRGQSSNDGNRIIEEYTRQPGIYQIKGITLCLTF